MKKYILMRFPNFLDKAVTLSYDDGVRADKRLIEIMSKYGLKGTFNINSGLFDYGSRMSVDEAKELYLPSGNEIAIHGVKHLGLAEVDRLVALDDVLNDRKNLEQIFGTIINGMAYAYGSYNDEVVEILKTCGVNYSRTVISTEKFDIPNDWLRLPTTCHHKNPRLMELVDKFLDNENKGYWSNPPKLFYLWGHSYEFDNDNNWSVIEEFAKKIGNREDVFYATNGEIYNYVKAFDSLEFSVDNSMIYNPSLIDVYINYMGNNILIKSGQMIKI